MGSENENKLNEYEIREESDTENSREVIREEVIPEEVGPEENSPEENNLDVDVISIDNNSVSSVNMTNNANQGLDQSTLYDADALDLSVHSLSPHHPLDLSVERDEQPNDEVAVPAQPYHHVYDNGSSYGCEGGVARKPDPSTMLVRGRDHLEIVDALLYRMSHADATSGYTIPSFPSTSKPWPDRIIKPYTEPVAETESPAGRRSLVNTSANNKTARPTCNYARRDTDELFSIAQQSDNRTTTTSAAAAAESFGRYHVTDVRAVEQNLTMTERHAHPADNSALFGRGDARRYSEERRAPRLGTEARGHDEYYERRYNDGYTDASMRSTYQAHSTVTDSGDVGRTRYADECEEGGELRPYPIPDNIMNVGFDNLTTSEHHEPEYDVSTRAEQPETSRDEYMASGRGREVIASPDYNNYSIRNTEIPIPILENSSRSIEQRPSSYPAPYPSPRREEDDIRRKQESGDARNSTENTSNDEVTEVLDLPIFIYIYRNRNI